MMTHAFRLGALVAAPILSLTMCDLAVAQDTAVPPQAPVANPLQGDIVVTAQRREQNIQKVGVSITALSGASLDALGISSTRDIAQQIPALKISSFTPAFTTFNLRGISQNNFIDNLEAPIAFYYDDVYIGSMNAVGMPMFDTERLEVLRGPQGTLFGRNATGGLIQYRPRKATSDELDGYAEGTIGSFNQRAIEGAVGGAIAPDVRVRVAARYEKADGYVKAGEYPEGVKHLGRSAFGADGYVVRGNLQVGHRGGVLLDLSASYARDNDVPVGQYVVRFAGANPVNGLGTDPGPIITGSPWRHASDSRTTGLDRTSWITSGKLSAPLSDSVTLSYVLGYVDTVKANREDAGGGLFPFDYTSQASYRQWSNELRLAGDHGALRWQVGAYQMDIHFEGTQRVTGPIITGFDDGIIDTNTRMRSKNWSVFGQAEYDLSPNLTLIGGLRWSQDDKHITFRNIGYNIDGVPGPTVLFDVDEAVKTNPAYAGLNRIDYGDWAGRLQLNYTTPGETLLYVSLNRGIKGGNWTPSSAVTAENFRHDAEKLVSAEAGVKTRILDGKGRINASVYRYFYDGYQAFSLTNLVAQIKNTDASSYGGEIELALTPSPRFNANLGVSYIHSSVDFVQGVIPGTGVRDVEFPQAPRLAVNALVRYNVDVAGGNASIQLDGIYNTRQFMEGTNSQVSRQGAYAVANGRIGFDAANGVGVAFWVKNIFQKAYLLYNLDLGAAGFVEQVYAPPRQIGGSVSYRF